MHKDFVNQSVLSEYEQNAQDDLKILEGKRNDFWLKSDKTDFFKNVLSLVNTRFFSSYVLFSPKFVSPDVVVLNVFVQRKDNDKVEISRLKFHDTANVKVRKTTYNYLTGCVVAKEEQDVSKFTQKCVNSKLYRPEIYEDADGITLLFTSGLRKKGSGNYVFVTYELFFSYSNVSYAALEAQTYEGEDFYFKLRDDEMSFGSIYPHFAKFCRTQKFKKRLNWKKQKN